MPRQGLRKLPLPLMVWLERVEKERRPVAIQGKLPLSKPKLRLNSISTRKLKWAKKQPARYNEHEIMAIGKGKQREEESRQGVAGTSKKRGGKK